MSKAEKLKHFVEYGVPIKLMALLSEMVFTSNILVCYPRVLWAAKLLMQTLSSFINCKIKIQPYFKISDLFFFFPGLELLFYSCVSLRVTELIGNTEMEEDY